MVRCPEFNRRTGWMLVDGWAEKGSGPRSQLPQPAWAQVPRDKLALHHALRERGCAEPVNTRLPTPIAPPHLAAEPGAGAKTRRRRTGRCRTGGWREDPAEKDWPVTLTLPTSSTGVGTGSAGQTRAAPRSTRAGLRWTRKHATANTNRSTSSRCRTGGWREDPAEKDWPVTLTLPTSST